MKQQTRLASGFMLVEAVIGVALFALLALGILHGVGFIAQRIAITAQRHKALCTISSCMPGEISEADNRHALPYTHPAISWHRTTKSIGKESLYVHRACCRSKV